MLVTRNNTCKVSPFGHPGINARLSTPPGLSQIPTSFIGSQCQGIHHAPLKTYKHKNAHKQEQTQNKHKNNQKNYYSKIFAENNNHTPTKRSAQKLWLLDARVHYTVPKQQPTHPTPHPNQPVHDAVSSMQTPKTTRTKPRKETIQFLIQH